MPGRFDFTGPADATNRPIYVGDYRSLFLAFTGSTVDYSTGFTFLAEIARDRLPTTSEVATFTVTPQDGGLLLELGEQSSLLGPLLVDAEPAADGSPPTSASAFWDLQVTEVSTGRPTTLLSGRVKIEGDVSRA